MEENPSAINTARRMLLEKQLKELRNEINQLKKDLEDCNERLQKMEESYISLSTFRREVIPAQDSFYGANCSGAKRIDNLVPIMQNNSVAERYHAGMSRIYKGIASKLASGLFQNLVDMSNSEMKRLRTSMDQLSAKKDSLTKKLKAAESRYKLIKNDYNSL